MAAILEMEIEMEMAKNKLIVVNETLTSLAETTWIGLQVRTLEEVEYPDGTTANQTGCYWPGGVRPRLEENDPCPKQAVEECSVIYDDTFRGQWEDGHQYDEEESSDFWSPDEPDQFDKYNCKGMNFAVDAQSRAYCERGVDGEPDQLQHCVLILPPDEKQVQITDEGRNLSAGKWADYWCWMKVRGYICERPARRSDETEGSTLPGMETQTSAPPASCEADDCASRARERVSEIHREISATRIGYSVVIETIALGGAAAGTKWLGESASFADLAQHAIDFGRNIARLSAEVRHRPTGFYGGTF
ncbi:hypothetical protein AAVH_11206 [Aphelenchoides avenae]|nr:hypothetical protein AAVH_11206 [Aphelenchus avenae]